MFSTSPTMPTALTLALRAPSRRISPITAPAPAMSHFMSPMPAAGLIEMPPVSNVTPFPTKAIGAAARGSAAMLHDDQTGRPDASLRDPEQRPHAELAHAVLVEDLDREAKFGEGGSAFGQCLGIKRVGRLGHQIAREGNRLGGRAERPVRVPAPRREPRSPP